MCSGETKLSSLASPQLIWRKRNADPDPKNAIPTAKHRGERHSHCQAPGWKYHALGLFLCMEPSNSTEVVDGRVQESSFIQPDH